MADPLLAKFLAQLKERGYCAKPSFGLRVSGFGFRVSGSGFNVSGFGLGFMGNASVFRVQDLGLKMQGEML